MKYDLDKIKLGLIKPLVQITIFKKDGTIIQSCNSMMELEEGKSIYDRFDFIACMEDYFQVMEIGEDLRLNPMEWHEEIQGLFVSRLAKIDAETIQWILIDKSIEQERVKAVLMGRDRAVLNEEYLQIEKTLLETKKELLEYRNEELARIQKFKERFFASISHEMRTPLNSITGLVKLLEWSDPKAIYDYLHALKATSQHLNHIINDVLDFSKIEEGKLILENISFNLKDIIDVVIKGFGMIVQEKSVELKVNYSEDLPTFVKGDPTRMSQILYNLIGNSMKFTNKGAVSLDVSKKENQLFFKLTDTGIGMSEETIARIIEPYSQAEGQQFHEFGGTGLGMTIASELVKIMGGELKISSVKGKGTNMSFAINYQPASKAEYSVDDHYDPSANVDVSKFSFLFAEDDAISNMIMKERSAKWNLNSTFVMTADDLEAELLEVQHDILISDLHLGDDYAPDLLKRLRKSDAVNKDIPFIFLSGDPLDLHPDLNQLDNWTYLVKPVNPRELSIKVREMLNLNKDNTLPAIDLTSLGNAAAHDKDFMKEIIDTILATLPEELGKLYDLILTDKLMDASKVLHKIKPSISYFGIPTLLEERATLHDKAKKGLEIKEEFEVFRTRINIALESLAAKKQDL